jgi:two-component system, OmpR family, response regulator
VFPCDPFNPLGIRPSAAIYGPSTARPSGRSDIGSSLNYGRYRWEARDIAFDPRRTSKPATYVSGTLHAHYSCPSERRHAKLSISESPALFRERRIPLMGNSSRILIVDDSRANAEALAASLAIDGLETRFALSGVDAIQLLGFWQPHVSVLDISMPEHNGFAVARVLRSMPATRDTGIIAFTALARAEFVATGPVVDFDGYCQKGGSHAPLLKMINGMLA